MFRRYLAAAAVAINVTACAQPAPVAPPPSADWASLQQQLLALVDDRPLTRDDGEVYGIDVAQLALYAAHASDRPLYERLIDGAARDLLVFDDDFAPVLMAWRTRRDATGTTETLRLARALELGAERFGRESDRTLSRSLITGYAGHAQIDRGVWFIANYYNLGTHALATNSYLVDYDVDLLTAMAPTIADQVRALVTSAVAPTGLIYDLVQPEISTLMPHLTGGVFSPNDIVQVSNSCTVAERAVETLPLLGWGVLAFVAPRLPALALAYYGRDGAPAARQIAGVETFACLTRLALELGDDDLAEALRQQFAVKLTDWLHAPQEPFAYTASEALLTVQCIFGDC